MSNSTSVITDLIENLKDGQLGFRAAAEDAQSSELKTLFNEFSLQRSKFAGELQSLAHTLGDHDPKNSGSISGGIHRGWINLKAALTKRDDHAILEECERGEDAAVAAFKDALSESNLPRNVADIVQTQYAAIQESHDRVRDLRDSTATQ